MEPDDFGAGDGAAEQHSGGDRPGATEGEEGISRRGEVGERGKREREGKLNQNMGSWGRMMGIGGHFLSWVDYVVNCIPLIRPTKERVLRSICTQTKTATIFNKCYI